MLASTSHAQLRSLEGFREYRARRGTKPQKAFLLIPHTNELPAVNPYKWALGKALRKMGIETHESYCLDRMRWGWEARRALGRTTYHEGNKSCNYVLSTRDLACRLEAICSRLPGKNESAALFIELHAYNAFNGLISESEWDVITGTRILVKRTPINLFREMSKFGSDADSGQVHDIAGHIGFNLDAAVKRIEILLGRLKREAGRIMMLEVPSVEEILPTRHPMYGHYFFEERGKEFSADVSIFEEHYCTCIRKGMEAPTKEEIAAVASILVLPPKKG